MDSNSLPAWLDFFTFVGLVAGGLTGLIFVALTIHVTEVTARSAYIARARTTLGALTGFIVLCGLALIPGQTTEAFGLECLLLFAILIGDVVWHFRDFEAPGGKVERPLVVRTAVALFLFAVGVAGALGLILDVPWALFVLGVSALLGLPVRVIQAWALLAAALPVQRLPADLRTEPTAPDDPVAPSIVDPD
jgi:hypothetical protein